MRRLATIGFVLAMSLGVALSALSQQSSQQTDQSKETKTVQLSDRAKQMVERRLRRLDEVLNLTPEQEKKVRAILEKFAANFSGMDRERFRNMSPEERRQAFEKFRAIREKTNAEIEKVLTKEQVEKFRKMQREGRRRRGRRPRR